MLKADFLVFYDKIVCEYANQFVNLNDNYEFNSNALRVYEEYLNQKTLMKVVMNKTGAGQLLDRHKVCAAMTVAILKAHLVTSKSVDDAKKSYTLADATQINEQIAFYSSWALFVAFLKQEKVVPNDCDLVLPETRHNDGFADTFSRSLFFANLQNSLCPELIANTFFLLEAYNCVRYEHDKKCSSEENNV